MTKRREVRYFWMSEEFPRDNQQPLLDLSLLTPLLPIKAVPDERDDGVEWRGVLLPRPGSQEVRRIPPTE